MHGKAKEQTEIDGEKELIETATWVLLLCTVLKNIDTLKIHIIIIKLFKIHWILFPLRK